MDHPIELPTIDYTKTWLHPDGHLWFTTKAHIDSDGSDNRHRDPCWQAETSLKRQGQSIDAECVPYIALPPAIIQAVPGIVLGCRVRLRNITTKESCDAVVADVGPRRKLGEISCEAARRIGLDGNPNHGGTDARIISYEIWPGVPAVVDGETYKLQRFGA